jgi:hypothetical protein
MSQQSPILHQDAPIADAVSNAFDVAPSTNQIDPKLIQQLTEQVTTQVLKNLHAINIPSSAEASFSRQSSIFSNSSSKVGSLEKSYNYKPPSVNDEPLSPDRSSYDGHYPSSNYSATSRSSRRPAKESREPALPDLDTGLRRRGTTTDSSNDELSGMRTIDRRGSADAAAGHKLSGARKDSLDPADSLPTGTNRTRPPKSPIAEEPSTPEPTTLEKIWKPLFQPDGEPTQRLGQLLRGLADHLIRDYEPKDSLVIGPRKMLRFFDETAVSTEHYPWRTIFGGNLSYASLGNMYRKLLCQYHLIQSSALVASTTNHDLPNIPALTPHGFARFMSTLMQAHPDTECARMCRALVLMPISNADDKAERLPKELPRSLLPRHANLLAEQRLISSLDHEPELVPLGRRASATMPPPPPGMPPSAMRRTSTFDAPRTSKRVDDPLNNGDNEDDDTLFPPAVIAERERKPYHGKKDGLGTKYDSNPAPPAPRERDYDQDRNRGRYEDDYNHTRYNNESTDSRRPRSIPKPAGPSRTQSTNAPPPDSSYNRRQYSPPTAADVRRPSRAEVVDAPPANQDRRRSHHRAPMTSDTRDSGRRDERDYQESRQSRSTGNGHGNGYSSSAAREGGYDRERERERERNRA